MNSIFLQIKGVHYHHPQQAPKKESKEDIVSKWKADNSLLNTQAVIELLKPTIDSALHTYTPGQLNSFRIKAINIALDSLKNYDPAKKVSPGTYVFTSLQRLNRLRRDRENIIHIPLSQVYLKSMVDKKKDELLALLGREPTLDLLGDATGMSKKKLAKIYSGNATVNLTATLNPESGDSTFKLKDLTDDDYFKYVYYSVSPIDQKIMLWSNAGAKTLSNNLIARKLRLSPGAVSQRKAKIQAMLGLVRGLL